jgi:hypothetical protein
MISYLILFAVLFIVGVSFVINEADEDGASIRAGRGDKHIEDVLRYSMYALIAGLATSLLWESWGGMIAIPIYFISRFSLFNRFLNSELGNDRWYLSDRGWDKFYKWILPNKTSRAIVEGIILYTAPVYLYPLYQWLDAISIMA